MFTSTKIGSGSKSLNKTSPGFFLKSPAVLALGIVLVAVLVLVALFVVKQRKASNAKRTTATAVTIPTLSAEASPKTTPPATPPPPAAASPETTPPAKTTPPPAKDPLYARLAATKVPMVAFRDAPLDQVLATLTELSSSWDPEKKGSRSSILATKRKNRSFRFR
jgi:type IV secretory pathway VirB10-like protein